MVESPILLILAIFAAGALLVLLPVALTSFGEHRRDRFVRCPEADRPARIQIDAGRAVRGALLGKSWLRVESCSLWPKRRDCAQACLAAAAPWASPTTPPAPDAPSV
jgi:hypothetical protein